MTTARHLSTSRQRFVFNAHQTAELVDQNLYALRAASNGRIDAKTAPEMRVLADRITKLHVAPRRTAGPVKPIVHEALKVIRAVRAALATLDDPTLHEQLKRTALTARRSTAQMLAALDTHASFVESHGGRVRPILPEDIDAKLACSVTRSKAAATRMWTPPPSDARARPSSKPQKLGSPISWP
jgi:hypothetical protein